MSAAEPSAAAHPGAVKRGRSAEVVDRLALAFQAGESAALVALHARLAADVNWLVGRAAYRLAEAPSLDLDDLKQEAWLALAEAAREWRPERDGAFRRYAIRVLGRTLRRTLRRQSARGGTQLGKPPADDWRERPEPVDRAPHADPSRWSDAIAAREIARGLPPEEWQALHDRLVFERPLREVAADLGVTRHTAKLLVRRARLRAQTLLGATPSPTGLEVEVRAGVDPWTGRGPTSSWVMARTGLGRRRLRAALERLATLGYVHRQGYRWHAAEGEEGVRN